VKTARPGDRAFWDASGIVLLCVHQPSTAAARRFRTRLGPIAIWWGTSVEVRSALNRVHVEGGLSPTDLAAGLRRLSLINDASLEVTPSEAVRTLACSAIDGYGLRAGDALQLAAALVLCRERPRGRSFVCFDDKLAVAADLAGFIVCR
jgi:predicted nucleic acid-binding protein